MKRALVVMALVALAVLPRASMRAVGSILREAPAGALSLHADEDGAMRVTTHGETLLLQTRTRDRDGAIERWDALPTRDGFEESWTYATKPTADDDGPLRIQVDASGLTYRGQDARGLLFGHGGHGVRYGRATWVDANGVRTDVSERFDRGAIALEVPRAVLEGSAYPATLDPTVTDEGDLDPKPATTFAAASAIAAIGVKGRFFAVQELDDDSSLLGVHVDPTTALPVPSEGDGFVVVSSRPEGISLGQLALAFDGASTIALSWTQNSRSSGSAKTDLYVAFLDPVTGQPKTAADLAGRLVASDIGSISDLTLAWDSAHFVASFLASEGNTVMALRFDDTGSALPADGKGVTIASSLFDQSSFGLACGTAGCLYGWALRSSAAYVAYYDPATGTVGAPIMVGMILNPPGIAWDPTNARYFVYTPTSSPNARFFGPTPSSPSTAFSIADTFTPNGPWSMIFDGVQFVAATLNNVASFAATIADGGAPTISNDVITVSDPFGASPSLAGVGGVTLLAYISPENLYGPSVALCLNAATGAIAPADEDATHLGVVLSRAENDEEEPLLAASSSGVWASWLDDRRPGYLYDGSSSSGTPYLALLDPVTGHAEVLVVDPTYPPANESQFSASRSLVTDGPSAITLSADTKFVRLARLGADGAIVGSVVVSDAPPTSDYSDYAMAYGGGHLFLVETDGTSLLERVFDSASLAPVSAWSTLVNGSATTTVVEPVIASDGTNALVAWHQTTSNPLVGIVEGMRIAPTGAALDPTPTVFASRLNPSDPAIAYGHGEYLLVWTDETTTKQGADLSGVRIGTEGTTIGDVLTIAPTDVNQLTSTAVADAADGVSFLVAWSTAFSATTNTSIELGLIGLDGTVRQPDGMEISPATRSYADPAIASVGPGQVLVLAQSGLGTESRIGVMRLSTGQTSGACTSDNDCASLACFDGFCCDRACGGACETCAATPGKCTSVQSAPDSDTCSGAKTCSAAGVCTGTDAQGCSKASDCASGFCVAGVCCDGACAGSCETCAAVLGKCTTLAAGNAGNAPSCTPYVCDGAMASCPGGCTSDDDCARPYTCSATGACELLTGAACADDETLETANASLVKCTPYACHQDRCAATCGSIADCANGFVCDAEGTCVDAASPAFTGGCSLTSSGNASDVPWLALALFLPRRRRRALKTLPPKQ